MVPRRRPPRASGKRALLAGAAVASLWWAPAFAQAPQVISPPGKDGLQQDEMYMEADEVVRDDDAGLTTATGHIEVRYNGRTLRADKLVYDDKTGVIRGYGHIVIINSDGSTEYADEVVLDEDMRAGVALGFSARLQENVKIAAASASNLNVFFD
jgi:LPS-assembly protein